MYIIWDNKNDRFYEELMPNNNEEGFVIFAYKDEADGYAEDLNERPDTDVSVVRVSVTREE